MTVLATGDADLLQISKHQIGRPWIKTPWALHRSIDIGIESDVELSFVLTLIESENGLIMLL